MNPYYEKGMSNICRVCLEDAPKFYPLEGPIVNSDVYISQMLFECTGIKVSLEDDLPKEVCVPCFKTLRIAYNFIKDFKEANEKLLKMKDFGKKELIVKVENNLWDEQGKNRLSTIEDDTVDESEITENCDSDTQLSNGDVPHDNSEEFAESEEEIIIKYVDDNGYDDDDEDDTAAIESSYKLELENNEDESEDIILETDSAVETMSSNNSKQNLRHRSTLIIKMLCPVCSRVYTSIEKLLNHVGLFHVGEKLKCNLCSLSDEMSFELYAEHCRLTHLNQCPFCKKKFGTRTSYNFHIKVHTENNPFDCPYENCEKSYPSQRSLKKHLTTHSAVANYICSKCGKKFNSYDNFKYHIKTHDGKRDFLCTICGKAFLQSVHLKYHMWGHTGVKQFRCEDCGRSYSTVSHLKKHRSRYCGSEKYKEKLKARGTKS
ncbi:hypothetical protein NQ315_005514 [Exocentrus adspersus]|uniref:Uncharacterized protein n=1 Tax=Exocentrus adspersus TaxID=1586481 RepID=A0AAV8VU01_9CUCU|nr:hypothetical protein NQ315_005514 [Exocentrus adspersus]